MRGCLFGVSVWFCFNFCCFGLGGRFLFLTKRSWSLPLRGVEKAKRERVGYYALTKHTHTHTNANTHTHIPLRDLHIHIRPFIPPLLKLPSAKTPKTQNLGSSRKLRLSLLSASWCGARRGVITFPAGKDGLAKNASRVVVVVVVLLPHHLPHYQYGPAPPRGLTLLPRQFW